MTMFYLLTKDTETARKLEGFSHLRKGAEGEQNKVFFRATSQFRAESAARKAFGCNKRVVQSSAR